MQTVDHTTSEIDIPALLNQVIQLKGYVESYKSEIERMQAIIDYLQRSRFGSKADTVIDNGCQLELPNLFDEAEAITATTPAEDEVEVVAEHTRRKRGWSPHTAK